MPFHSHHHTSSSGQGAAQGIFAATQALGSVAAPHSNLRIATAGTTGADTDALLPGSGNDPRFSALQSAPPSSASASGLPAPGSQSAAAATGPQFEVARRPVAQREPEDLHIPPAGQQSASHSQLFNSPVALTPGGGAQNLNISLQHATPPQNQQPQDAQFANSASSVPDLPAPLQPGPAAGARPAPSASYTAPTTVPKINTNAQQYTLPTRSSTMQSSSSTHSYSRSSPAGLDQKYIPFNSTVPTPEMPKYAPTPSQRHYQAQTPSGAASNSPLALSDIRPRANSTIGEDMPANTTLMSDLETRAAGNCNYLAPWPVYAYDWCKWPVHGGNSAGKMAVGSYLEDPHNFIQIIDTHIAPQEATTPGAPAFGVEYTRVAEATCSYPVTRILWEPPSSQKQSTDLLATSGDHLRLWSLPQTPASNVSNTISRSSPVNTRDPPAQKLTPLALLSNSKSPEHTAPLTSLDWNTLSPKLIITSSIDTTCTIWDIPTLTAKTQLIAHDKEVFDVRFCAGSVDVFVSCGADGSVRMFDLRSLEHSTIIYEPTEKREEKGSPGRMSPTKAQQMMSYAPPLLRLAASPHDAHLLATFASDSNLIRILDVRQPGQALLELRGHQAAVNSIEWSPTRRGMLASGGDDSMVLVWDLIHSQNGATINGEHATSNGSANNSSNNASSSSSGVNMKGPAASWRCDYEVGNLSWAPQSGLTTQGGEWLGVTGGRGVWGIKL
ncbi:WD repeat-containing protein [Lasiodiplodia hormozganensis]|uniref:WD repeat-containing protein n=1 Tax=Lasiodiplodia hormozganensis TaxID=869390 RepID=A0AA40CJB5_9PEZI|nr:WD repeat-containing protein [Lasiodiplodia hormozganensis]